MSNKILFMFYSLAAVLCIAYIAHGFKVKQDVIETQRNYIAELEAERAVLSAENETLNTEMEILRDENESLRGEIEYMHMLLDDPTAMFGNGLYELTPEDELEMMYTAMDEAGGQGIIGKALVMKVILNRMEKYGLSAYEVIHAPNQFYCSYTREPDEECEIALLMVTAGWDGSQGAMYFCSNGYNAYGDEQLFKYRGHWFSR